MVPEISPRPDLRRGALRRDTGLSIEFNLPNLITLARLISVPVAIWLILDERYGAAFWLFVAAGLSDAVDGFIAKRFDRQTRLGALLDPAADKMLLAGVYVSLGWAGQLPLWLVVLVVLRDTLIVLGFLAMQKAAAPKPLGPLYVSKVNTLVQIALIGFVLARLGLDVEAGAAAWLLIVAAGATTVLSGLSYLARWARSLSGSERGL